MYVRGATMALVLACAVVGCGEDDLDRLQRENARVASGLSLAFETDFATSVDAVCFKGKMSYGCHVYKSDRQNDGPATLLTYSVTWHPNTDGDKEWRAVAASPLAGLPRVVEFDAIPDFAPDFG